MLKRILNNRTALCNLLCALLMTILLVLQFTPFWQYGEAGESVSISGYVWFPSDHKALETWLGEQVEGFNLNSFVGTPILILALSTLGAVLCLIKPDRRWTAVLPIACGAAGTICYLSNAALKLGMGWTWHLLICILLLAIGIFNLACQMKKNG